MSPILDKYQDLQDECSSLRQALKDTARHAATLSAERDSALRDLRLACEARNKAVERAQELEKQKNGAYSERNQVVALVARMAACMGWEAGRELHPESDTAWERDWRTIVFVDLPTGQASWHFHDSEQHLLGWLPRYVKPYDGHSTEEKYRRVNAALQAPCIQADHECARCGHIEQPCRICAHDERAELLLIDRVEARLRAARGDR